MQCEGLQRRGKEDQNTEEESVILFPFTRNVSQVCCRVLICSATPHPRLNILT